MKSYWNKNLKSKYSKIQNHMKTHICIIGGGLTGLSLGYYLSKDKDIVILEKDTICSSTSGKNTGKLSSQHGLFYNYLINSNGPRICEKIFRSK